MSRLPLPSIATDSWVWPLLLSVSLTLAAACSSSDADSEVVVSRPARSAPQLPPLFADERTDAQAAALDDAIRAYGADQTEQALLSLRQLASDGPWSRERLHASLWLAQELARQGKHREALELRELIAHDGPPSADAWLDLAHSYRQSNQPLDTIAALRSALHLEPDMLRALWLLETVLEERGLIDDALETRLNRERLLNSKRVYISEHAQSVEIASELMALDLGVRDPWVARAALAAMPSRHPEVQAAAQQLITRNAPPSFAPLVRAKAERLEPASLSQAWLEVADRLEALGE